MKPFVIEMWDIDTNHPFLYTEDGEIQEFSSKADAQMTVDYLWKQDGADSRYNYHITDTPSRFAKPLPKQEF